MDSFSHIALGACVGYAIGGKRLGRRAMAVGALAATVPDFDNLALIVSGEWGEWRHHRGATHGLLFAALAGPLLGWIAWRRYNRLRPFESYGAHDAGPAWMKTGLAAMLTHPLLDFFTIYGTQLLAPFDDTRFAVPGLGIIDPGYTLPLIAAALLALFAPRALAVKAAVAMALLGSSLYLFYGLSNNIKVDARARAQLAAENVPVADVRVYTTIFQPWLRRIVVDEADGTRVGFATASQKGAIAWFCFPRAHDPAIAVAAASSEAKLFAWFAMGEAWPQVAAGGDGSTVVRFVDRRYGAPGPTILGWWGVELRVGADGRIEGPAYRVNIARGVTRAAVGELFAASRGLATPMFPQALDAAQAAAGCKSGRDAQAG